MKHKHSAAAQQSKAQANKALSFAQQGRWGEAAQAWQTHLAKHSQDATAWANLAMSLAYCQRAPEAIDAYAKAMACGLPADQVSAGIGLVFCLRQQWDVARENLEIAVQANPNNLGAWSNLVVACTRLGLPQRAIEAAEQVLAVQPDNYTTLSSLGTLCKDAAQADEAIAWCERAALAAPHDAYAISNLLWAMLHSQSISAQELREASRRFEQRLAPSAKATKARDKATGRLRIGWVSNDLREHALGHFAIPVMEALAKHEIEQVVFSHHKYDDGMVRRARAVAAHWHHTGQLSDVALAQLIRKSAVDILIDLGGHTDGSRLAVFAAKPAPIQITWLGHPATSGLAAMDYIFVPPDAQLMQDEWSTETPLALPGCYCPREAAHPSCAPTLPARRAPDGHIVFSCLNNFSKASPRSIAAWAAILHAVPHSRLNLIATAGDDGALIADIVERFGQYEIAAERLSIHSRMDLASYIALARQTDIALDTFPFNGGTTGMDALCVGTPFVTLAGEALHQRMGAALLNAVGMPELIAYSVDDYVGKGVNLANDKARLAQLHACLRERVARSALNDVEGFAAGLASLLRSLQSQSLSAD